jgi:Ca2+-binding EF-hand superfamily protein
MIPLALLVLAAVAEPAAVDLVFPGGHRVRVAAPAGPAWADFLDRLHDHFDRDRDGALSAAEAARVFPLPLPDGTEVAPDFARLDADRDGKATRAEFRAFYRAAGFAPVVAAVRPPAAEHRRLARAVFRHLDRDADGALSRDELKAAPALLRRFDEDEDEVLTPAELLALEPPGAPPAAVAAVRVAPPAGTPDAVLRLAGADAATVAVPGGRVTVSAAPDADGFRAAADFFLAQFEEALGGKKALARADAEADPALQGVAGMFAAADRDGDGMLTAAELRALLDLVGRGVRCQVVVAVEDRGASPFDLLDADRDGRLDAPELRAAAGLPGAVPAQYRLAVGRGLAVARFGPVPVPTAPPKAPAKAAPPKAGPDWFRAADRNGDGFVSAAEFPGPPARFAELDRDRDGRISPAEAEAAGR